MIKFTKLTFKNFQSSGNVDQVIDLDTGSFVQITGMNKDTGGEDSSNGSGKTMILNAMHYALYGTAITDIRLDRLVNSYNDKNMLVVLELNVDGIEYRIERGRKPNVLKLYINGNEHDEAQGENRSTQCEIDALIGMSSELFLQIIGLNTEVDPFLKMKAADQRAFIEELLGISILTEKAEKLKEHRKDIEAQLQSTVNDLQVALQSNERIEQVINDLKMKADNWGVSHDAKLKDMADRLEKMNEVDIGAELQRHRDLSVWAEANNQYNNLIREKGNITAELERLSARSTQLETEIETLQSAKCHECGHELTSDEVTEKVKVRNDELDVIETKIDECTLKCDDIQKQIDAIVVPEKPSGFIYQSIEHASKHESDMMNLANQLSEALNETNPHTENVKKQQEIGLQPVDGIRAKRDELESLVDHINYLIKLLSDKSSFIRKRIIDQNLGLLNRRLAIYLEQITLSHRVRFLNDLGVEIMHMGKDYDFTSLSRGQRNRLILGLSWAFRDVYESLNKPIAFLFIDEIMDFGTDAYGASCCVPVLEDFVDRGKSVFLITHRKELAEKVSQMLRVTYENGFSTISKHISDR